MQQPSAGPAAGERYESDRARRILEAAAREQHSIDSALADSFSRAELQQIARDAGISAAALDAAIAAERRGLESGSRPSGEGPRHRGGRVGRVAGWFAARNPTALAAFGFVAVAAVLLGLWLAAPALFWVTSLSLTLVALLILMTGTSW